MLKGLAGAEALAFLSHSGTQLALVDSAWSDAIPRRISSVHILLFQCVCVDMHIYIFGSCQWLGLVLSS